MRDDAGTRLLAKTIRQAYDAIESPADLEQMHAAIMAVRNSPQRRISLYSFADRYLGGDARSTFLNKVKHESALHSSFNFQRDVFDETLQFRVFELDRGVFVSSPLTEVGESVRISGAAGDRTLTCRGRIVDEKLRTRHA